MNESELTDDIHARGTRRTNNIIVDFRRCLPAA